MRRLWLFLELKKNREILAWVGGGIAMVIGGLWTAFIYLSDAPKTVASSPSVTVSCGSIGVGGNVTGATITAGNTGNCPEQKPGPKL